MALLILRFQGAVEQEYTLGEQPLTIGRRPGNDIHIDNLAVSGDHAVIERLYNYHFVRDLDSTNGTLVNGKKINKQVLRHNDTIQIGKHTLAYLNEQAAARPEVEQTVAIRPRPRPAALVPVPDGPYLKVINGAGAGTTVELTLAATTIGKHRAPLAVVMRRGKRFVLRPGSRRHAVTVNGAPLEEEHVLSGGDQIEVDNTRLEFHD